MMEVQISKTKRLKNPFSYGEAIQYLAEQNPKDLRVIRFFPNSDLRCSHDGLSLLAKEHGIEALQLKAGEFLVFANTRKDKLKIYAPGNILVYVRSPNGLPIDFDMIRYIPRFFNGTHFNFPAALEHVIRKKLENGNA